MGSQAPAAFVCQRTCKANAKRPVNVKLKGPVNVKLIKRVKIAHSFLQSVSNQFHVIILSLPI